MKNAHGFFFWVRVNSVHSNPRLRRDILWLTYIESIINCITCLILRNIDKYCAWNEYKRFISYHDIVLLALEQERKLVDHGLNYVFNVWPLWFKSSDIVKLQGVQESWPPTDRQVLTVHWIQFAILRNPVEKYWSPLVSHWDVIYLEVSLRHFPSYTCNIFKPSYTQTFIGINNYWRQIHMKKNGFLSKFFSRKK